MPEPIVPEVKIEFTPEQQEYINNTLIKEAMGRAGKEARTKAEQLEAQVNDLNTKLSTLNTQLEEAKKGKATATGDDAKALKEEFERIAQGLRSEAENLRKEAEAKAKEAEKARAELLNVRKRNTMITAANKVGFVDVDAVMKLTDEFIDWDEEKSTYIVRGEDGGIRHNSAMRHMSLEEFYTDYAAKKPWLATGQMKGGSGSERTNTGGKNSKFAVEEIFGAKASAVKAMQLKRENPQEYERLKQIAKEANVIA